MNTNQMAFKLILQNKANLHIATVCSQIWNIYKPCEVNSETKQAGQLYEAYENLIVFLFSEALELLGITPTDDNEEQVEAIYDEFEIYIQTQVTPTFTK